MTTFATLFSGGELAGLGIAAAGLEHAWGLEINPAIAEVARANGFAVHTADILKCDPRRFERTDALHASPPCPNFSVAKAGAVETGLDIALAERTADFIRVLQPEIFTLENVFGYRLSRSFGIICSQLDAMGYWWQADHLNAANFGVPQTRRRLVLRAVRNRMLPALPPPTSWGGWYSAIEDLIPSLPESRFADWQLARLTAELSEHVLVGANGTSMTTVAAQEPAATVVSSKKTALPRTFIVSNAATEWGDGVRQAVAPAHAVTGESRGRVRAFIVGGANTSEEQAAPGVGVSEQHEPVLAVNGSNSLSWRAFIVDGKNGSVAHGDPTLRMDDEPAMTISASIGRRPANAPRAWLVNTREMHGNEEGSQYTAVSDGRPAYTLAATSEPTRHRAWLSAGRVVSMTPRALARFQSAPDSYVLPDKPGLACRIIGNGCPPKLMEALYRGLLA